MPRLRIAPLIAFAMAFTVAAPVACQSLVDTAWVARYNSPLNGSDEVIYLGREAYLRIDSAGNVYVLGYSNGVGTGTYDVLLVKYTPQGVKAWARAYMGPAAGHDLARHLELDAAGFPHVSLTEQVDGKDHFVTIKYTPDGDTIWSRSYNTTASTEDNPQALLIDASGSVLVLGDLWSETGVSSSVILKYNAGGNLLWERFWQDTVDGAPVYSTNGADIDDDGNIYIATGGNPGTIGLIKYSAAGDPVWQRAIVCGTHQVVYKLDVEGDRVYFTGGSNCDGLLQPLTAVYTTDGDSLWADRQLFAGQTSVTTARDLVVGGGGSVCVIGNFSVSSLGHVGAIKYDPYGAIQWEQTYASPGGLSAYDVSVDAAGFMYISGQGRLAPGGTQGLLVLKCDSSGDSLFSLWHNGGSNCGTNYSYTHRVDAVGNIYVSGHGPLCGGNNDIITIKYSPRCACFGDPACDGVVADVLDVVNLVEVAFRAASAPHDEDCYRNRMDLDCSGGIDIIDVVKIVEVAFRNSSASTEFCDPNGSL